MKIASAEEDWCKAFRQKDTDSNIQCISNVCIDSVHINSACINNLYINSAFIDNFHVIIACVGSMHLSSACIISA